MKIIGNIILAIVTLAVVLLCGFYSGMIGAASAGMVNASGSLEPLVYGIVGVITGFLVYGAIILILLIWQKMPYALATVFGTILALFASPIAAVIFYKMGVDP